MKKTLVFYIILLLFSCNSPSHKKILPMKYDLSKFNKAIFADAPIELGKNRRNLLMYIPVYGPMSFSSSNNHIGLYLNNIKKDEIILGSIPLHLLNWTNDTIYLSASGDKNYLDLWLLKPGNQKIGKFKIVWVY